MSMLRAGKRTLATVDRIKAMVAPLPAHLASIQRDLAQMQAVSSRQAARVGALYDAVEPSIRHGMRALTVARTVAGFVRRFRL